MVDTTLLHARGTVGTHPYHYYVVQVEAACTLKNTTWYTATTTTNYTTTEYCYAHTIYSQPRSKQRGQISTCYHGLGHDCYTGTIHHYRYYVGVGRVEAA